MKRHRQDSTDIFGLEKPTIWEVEHALEIALSIHRDTAQMYARHHFTDGAALAFLRAVQRFPPRTTIEQIQEALLRRSQVVRLPGPADHTDRTVA